MVKTFNDIMRERCRKLILKGQLERVIAAQHFLGQTDQQFGEFLAPIMIEGETTETVDAQKESVESNPKPVQEAAEPTTTEPTTDEPTMTKNSLIVGTVLLRAGYYEIVDEMEQACHVGTISEYRALDLHHGQRVQCREVFGRIVDLEDLGDDPTAPELRYIHHAIVELEPETMELYVERDINGHRITEYGCAFETFYLRQLAERFGINEGDTVDIYIKDDGYPHVNWAYRSQYVNSNPRPSQPTQTSTTKKPTPATQEVVKTRIDYDLTGKVVTIYGVPPRMTQGIEAALKQSGALDVRFQELGTNIAGFHTRITKLLSGADMVIIGKTGINHAMSPVLVDACKTNGIPFAYANQPSLGHIERAIYRVLNGLPSDEINAGDIQYPTVQK